MRKLEEVEDAKALMNEAMEWSAFKLLWEKQKVRETADRANATLERRERQVKSKWDEEFKTIYKDLSSAKSKKPGEEGEDMSTESQARLLVLKVLAADGSAKRARLDAEETFDEAEKQLSTSMALEGCKKAIHSWELQEKAIRKAEALMKAAPAGSKKDEVAGGLT